MYGKNSMYLALLISAVQVALAVSWVKRRAIDACMIAASKCRRARRNALADWDELGAESSRLGMSIANEYDQRK